MTGLRRLNRYFSGSKSRISPTITTSGSWRKNARKALVAPLLITRGQPDTQNLQKLPLKELKTLSRPAILGCLVSGLLLGPIYGLLPVYIAAQTEQAQYTGLDRKSVV